MMTSTNLRRVMLFHAILTIPYFFALVFFPHLTPTLLRDVPYEPVGFVFAQLLGGVMLMMMTAELLSIRQTDPTPHRIVALAVMLYLINGAIFSGIAMINDVWQPFGWINPALYAVFATLYGLFLYQER